MPSQGSTLTQRRNGHDDLINEYNPSARLGNDMNPDSNGGAVVRIIIWGIAILATGIGLALLVRSLTKTDEPDTNKDNDTVTEETQEEEETPEEEETETPEQEEEETPPTDTPATTSQNLTNEFSTQAQTISDGVTTNVVTVAGYQYATYADKFVYTIKLENTQDYPTVNASLNSTDKTLTLVVNNVQRDNIVGGQGSGSTQFALARNVTSVDISNTGNKTTFVYHMSKATQYRIFADPNGMNILLEIKNS